MERNSAESSSIVNGLRESPTPKLLIHVFVWIPMLALISQITVPMIVATFAYYLMILGLLYRRRRTRHVWLMGSAIALDLGLVLTLEIQRSAINAALNHPYTALQTAHIIASSLAVLFYLPTVYLGVQRLRHPHGPLAKRVWHIRMAVTAFVLRTAGFFLMFSMLGRSA